MSITYFEPTVKLIAVTQPLIKRDGSTLTPEESRNGVSAGDAVLTAEQFVVYVARVSNPSNKTNTDTAPRLIKYLLDHGHYSPLEHTYMSFEIETTRDISRQLLRHRSLTFQEWSGRYAEMSLEPAWREPRLQDTKNRQNSLPCDETSSAAIEFNESQFWAWDNGRIGYEKALNDGIAKEQARALLPEGLTRTTLMATGNLRSWVHYLQQRASVETQKEHRMIAEQVKGIVKEHFPNVSEALGW